MNRMPGYTLIELMITVVIIGVLAAVAIPAYRNYISTSEQSAALATLDTLRLYLEDFRIYNGGTYGSNQTRATGAVYTHPAGGALGSISDTFGWTPDGDGDTFTYSVLPYIDGDTVSYDVWVEDDNSDMWFRCDNRMNTCCGAIDGLVTTCL